MGVQFRAEKEIESYYDTSAKCYAENMKNRHFKSAQDWLGNLKKLDKILAENGEP
jgi:hypothetical protein